MPTLIGDGGHAADIWDTLTRRSQWTRIAHHSAYTATHREDKRYIIGINNPQLRAEISEEIGLLDQAWKHPTAHISNCEIGFGSHVGYMVGMTRTTVGRHCTIAPGVTICGDVTIGDRVFIGAGAIIVNLTTIPDDTFVKAGTVWTQR